MMQRAQGFSEADAASEMAIVDTFTKLIFGQEENQYDSLEQLIIQTFRLVEANVAVDSYLEMGHYLRAMGVAEMIQLVARVQAQLDGGPHYTAGQAAGDSILNRRAH